MKSPAKINISLDITGKTLNGYHLLNMITQTIDIFDYITFSKNGSQKINIYNTGLSTPSLKDNIIYKTIIKFFKITNISPFGVDITIKKNIPLQAGLGGGSSNAAMALVALNHLSDINLNINQLQDIGKEIGTDVPLFLLGGTCLCKGIGDIVTKLPDIKNVYFVVVKPSIGFSTPQIYKFFDEIKIKRHPNIDKIIEAIKNNDINLMCDNIYNVLEEAIPNKEILEIKKSLIKYGALASNMTGSGSAIFGIFKDQLLAKEAIKSIKKLYSIKQIFLCNPISSYN